MPVLRDARLQTATNYVAAGAVGVARNHAVQITWSFTKLAAVLILLSLISQDAGNVTSGASVTLVANIASTMLQQLYSVLALGGGYVLQRSWKPAAPKALDIFAADMLATCNGPRTQVKLPM